MRLICPSCGAIASAEAWHNETTVRQFLSRLEGLPGPVRDRALPYLGLFRAGVKNGLSWPRALRIMTGLAALVEPGTVQWEGGESRPSPPLCWADALDTVLARRPKNLENHNYLRRVAWEKAAALASQSEKDRERALAGRPNARDAEPGMTDDERAELARKIAELKARM